MTQQQHTALPWVVDTYDHGTWIEVRIYGDNGASLIAAGMTAAHYPDAALIVAAVNERPQLLARVAELEAALQRLAVSVDEDDYCYCSIGAEYDDPHSPRCQEARAALAKAQSA